jgi:ribonucleotide reductase beta subunit family protein with ferritin-like domain
MQNTNTEEEILTETTNRFVLYPIKYTPIWNMYKTAVSAFWQVEEIDLSKDIEHWENKLNDNERNFIENILSFFAASDGLVDENLVTRFYNDVKIPEARAFYTFQIAMETVHSEMYSLMLDTFVKDNAKREKLFNGMNTIPAIKRKADWAIKWIEDQNAPFSQRLVAFAVVEGIMFSGAFASIYWLKERNLMPGLCASNVAISRDESLHTEFAILLYSYLSNKLSEEQVHTIIKDAVDIEIQFITESIPCNMLGMNSNLMSEYVQYVADRLVSQLGYSKIYNTSNPFPFMDRIAMENKVNFFEERPLEYNKANVGKTDVYDFSLDEDF